MRNYVAVDIEATTGDTAVAQIIEIAILVIRDGQIHYQFESLVNPEMLIPPDIKELTGITDAMVASAPKFHEISDKIWDILQNEIFISHKTDFDYQLLQNYFARMGKELKLKTLCTFKLSQKLFEDLPSYSLSYMCRFLGIPAKNHHRAFADANMLFQLTEQLLPLFIGRAHTSVYLPHHQKILNKVPALPGMVEIHTKSEATKVHSCENMQLWLKDHLALSWDKKEYINDIAEIFYKTTGSFMASCLKTPQIKNPKYVIYQFYNSNGLIQLAWGKYIRYKPALLYFTDKPSCMQKFMLIKNELKHLHYFAIKGEDKTQVVRKNNLMAEILSKHIPRNESLLFRSFHKLQNRYTYVHIKGQKYYAIFESDKAIIKKNELPSVPYKKLTPTPYMQFLKAWQVIKNQRYKTDLILNV